MRNTLDDSNGRTFVPSEAEGAQFVRIKEQLEQQSANGATMRIVAGDGEELELPGSLFEVVRHIAMTLSEGRGISVMPHDTQLTTQEAADFLGISRPTLVKHLSEGEIPFSAVGRHRRVLLTDLLRYQEDARVKRRALLRRTAREGQQDGLFDVTYEPESE